jgi:hypothetical protein
MQLKSYVLNQFHIIIGPALLRQESFMHSTTELFQQRKLIYVIQTRSSVLFLYGLAMRNPHKKNRRM